MKKPQEAMRPSLLMTLVVVLSLLVPLRSQPAIDGPVQDLINKNSDFATRLYRALASRTDNNILLSTVSLSHGLSALLGATSGSSQDQLQQVLGLAGLDLQSFPELFQSMKTVLLGGGALNLKQGVALFPDLSIQVSTSYLDLVQTKYGETVKSLAYSTPQEAADTINNWLQQQTGDQVQDLVADLDPQTQLMLATAALYQGRLSQAFNASVTQDERFFVDKYHVVMVPMMFRADKYFLAYDRSLKVGVLKLPMVDGAAMLVVLPDENVDINAVEEEVTAEKIQSWIRQLKKTKLEVQLPRFLLDNSYSLRDVLQTLGMVQVFQDDADLSNMGAAEGTKLSQVFHKAVLSVNESGGNDTPGGRSPVFSTPPPRLTINRPFIFVVYHQTSGGVLLMGRLLDPTKK
ncbi:protein Z-dependent protease inhibitor [Nerophis lumbriciformis]|uniref:protein Z-dependent protease inhibitor n=1 Tax=Nerophis lumbriciformis TaxID=546530 RepID=UPI002AE009FF|nr:serpin peptidase inhibitor, clade A (alpha-1 antiproteinase, antitrypsin), member 10a [Nerophis lumbriciformis]